MGQPIHSRAGFAALALLVASSLAAQDKPLSLADCYRLAEQNQPDLATAEAEVHVAEAHLKERRSPYFPHLSFGATHNQQTYNYSPTPGTSPTIAGLQYNGERWSNSSPTLRATRSPSSNPLNRRAVSPVCSATATCVNLMVLSGVTTATNVCVPRMMSASDGTST